MLSCSYSEYASLKSGCFSSPPVRILPRVGVPEEYVKSAFDKARPKIEKIGLSGFGRPGSNEDLRVNIIRNAADMGFTKRRTAERRIPRTSARDKEDRRLTAFSAANFSSANEFDKLQVRLKEHPSLRAHRAGQTLSPGQISAIKGVIRQAYRAGHAASIRFKLVSLLEPKPRGQF
jgi:hypothetical protein